MTPPSLSLCRLCGGQIFPGLILSDIKPAKRMKFKTVCYILVQLMHCRKMFKAEIPFSNAMTCDDDDKVCVCLCVCVSVCVCVCSRVMVSEKERRDWEVWS